MQEWAKITQQTPHLWPLEGLCFPHPNVAFDRRCNTAWMVEDGHERSSKTKQICEPAWCHMNPFQVTSLAVQEMKTRPEVATCFFELWEDNTSLAIDHSTLYVRSQPRLAWLLHITRDAIPSILLPLGATWSMVPSRSRAASGFVVCKTNKLYIPKHCAERVGPCESPNRGNTQTINCSVCNLSVKVLCDCSKKNNPIGSTRLDKTYCWAGSGDKEAGRTLPKHRRGRHASLSLTM